MGPYGHDWLQCEWCWTWGKALRILPPGVIGIIDVDALGALICEPCMDRGPPSHLSAWIGWRRQQPMAWDTRIVNRGVGYEIVAVPMEANAKGEGCQGYQPTRGKDNGGKGTREEPVGKGKGDQVEAQRWRTKGKGQRGEGQGEAIRQLGGGGKASTGKGDKQGKGNGGQAKGYKPTERIYV